MDLLISYFPDGWARLESGEHLQAVAALKPVECQLEALLTGTGNWHGIAVIQYDESKF